MEITIIETGEQEELSIIDPISGCDWTNDLLGNHNELPEYNDDDGRYHMLQAAYDWWDELIEEYQAADNRSHEILNGLTGDDYDNMNKDLQDINCDLEDFPATVNGICNQYENLCE